MRCGPGTATTGAQRRPLDQIVGQSIGSDIHSASSSAGRRSRRCTPSGGASDRSVPSRVAGVPTRRSGHAALEFDDAGFASTRSRSRCSGRTATCSRAPRRGPCGAARGRSTPTSVPTGSRGSPRPTASRTRRGWRRSRRAPPSVRRLGRPRGPARGRGDHPLAGDGRVGRGRTLATAVYRRSG